MIKPLPVETFDVTRQRLSVICQVSAELLSVEGSLDRQAESIIVQSTYHLFAHNHRKAIKHPKTWWDAFKIAYFPKSLLRRYPPRYTEYDVWSVFPEFVPPRGLGREMRAFHLADKDWTN